MSSPHYERAVAVLDADDSSAEALYGAAVGLRGSFERAEHLIGLLPGDAPRVMIECFRAAAERGSVAAMLDLASLYERGGIAPWARFPAHDAAAAIALYRQADAAGSRDGALGWVRTAYFVRDAVHATSAMARLVQLHSADPEDREALLFLGYLLQQGYGGAADPEAGARFLGAAAARGDAAAAFELSVVYGTGLGAPQDTAEGHRWTIRAAELGSDRAQSNLGGMYATGNGVPKDATTAVDWYRRAGESGNARAAFVAGVMLLTGDDGLPPDTDAAAAQLSRADELGYPVDEELNGMGLGRPGTRRTLDG